MRVISKISALLLVICMAVLFTGCGDGSGTSAPGTASAEKVKINIAALKGPTGIILQCPARRTTLRQSS